MSENTSFSVALGIDDKAIKHPLGLYEGATENSTACGGLLSSDLEARGVRTDRTMLFVVDGSKALTKAIRAKFGARALVSNDARSTRSAISRTICRTK